MATDGTRSINFTLVHAHSRSFGFGLLAEALDIELPVHDKVTTVIRLGAVNGGNEK